jgi:hypothetical protein
MHAATVNNERVHQAVQFLAANADQNALTGFDPLKELVYAVSAGRSPDSAYLILKAMILVGTPIWPSGRVPTENKVV